MRIKHLTLFLCASAVHADMALPPYYYPMGNLCLEIIPRLGPCPVPTPNTMPLCNNEPVAAGSPPMGTVVPPMGTIVPPVGPEVPPTTTDVPPMAIGVPPTTAITPPTSIDVPPTATIVPPTTAEVPPTTVDVPPAINAPPTTAEVPPTTVDVPPAINAPPTTAEVPPTTVDVPPAINAPPTTIDVPPTTTFVTPTAISNPPTTTFSLPKATRNPPITYFVPTTTAFVPPTTTFIPPVATSSLLATSNPQEPAERPFPLQLGELCLEVPPELPLRPCPTLSTIKTLCSPTATANRVPTATGGLFNSPATPPIPQMPPKRPFPLRMGGMCLEIPSDLPLRPCPTPPPTVMTVCDEAATSSNSSTTPIDFPVAIAGSSTSIAGSSTSIAGSSTSIDSPTTTKSSSTTTDSPTTTKSSSTTTDSPTTTKSSSTTKPTPTCAEEIDENIAKSCRNFTLQVTKLAANCRGCGTWINSKIDLDHYIGNADGNFEWKRGFAYSARNITVYVNETSSEVILKANLRRIDVTKWNENRTIALNERIKNIEGELTYRIDNR